MNKVINNNKYKLKYWFAMLYIHGRKFMIGCVYLSKAYFTVTLPKFGCHFLCTQKWLPISKMPCITPCIQILKQQVYTNQEYQSHMSTYTYYLGLEQNKIFNKTSHRQVKLFKTSQFFIKKIRIHSRQG